MTRQKTRILVQRQETRVLYFKKPGCTGNSNVSEASGRGKSAKIYTTVSKKYNTELKKDGGCR